MKRSGKGAFLQSLFGPEHKEAGLACLFGSFVFLQFTVLALANHAGEGYLSTDHRVLVYYFLQVFVILGYLSHSLYARFCRGRRGGKAAAYTFCGVFFVCATRLLAGGTDSLLHVIASMAAAFCVGGIGGAVHCRMSREAAAGAKVARSMGFGSSAAVLLQYLLQICWGVTPVLPVFMLAAFLLLLFLLSGREAEPEGAGEGKQEPVRRLQLVCSVLIAATFILLSCFYNESIHHLMIQSGYTSANVYSWPRLMFIPGYLLFALIGDRKGGKYVPIASLCIVLAALLNVMLIGTAGSYWVNMCLFYLSISAYTCYYLLTFWRLAPGTRHPTVWAPFGRMLDSIMVLFTGAIGLSEISAPVVMGVDLAGVALVIVLMAFKGDFNLSGSAGPAPAEHDPLPSEGTQRGLETAGTEAPEVLALLSPEETLNRIRERFDLTPREMEVLRELALTEDKQTVISEKLSIQVRTLQNHVTQLYRKTGVTTRAGLTELYHASRQQN